MTPRLTVSELSRRFGAVRAVDGVSFALRPGTVTALIGPNGAGKSSLFALLAGQLRPQAGQAWLAGRRLAGEPPERVFRLGVGRGFQVARVLPSMTVAENVQLARLSQQGLSWRPGRRAARAFRGEALALLSELGLAGYADRPCGELAYGLRKRVDLALALAGRPQLLLLDEPTAGLAGDESAALMAAVAAAADRPEAPAVLFTEHDMAAVFGHAGRVLVMAEGRLVADGPPAAVRADPRVQAVYLGEGGDA